MMTFAREAWPFVVPFWLAAAVFAASGYPWWGVAAAVAGFLVLLFFRDPARRFDGEESAVLAPADGLVTRVDTVEDPAVGPGHLRRVVTFLSAFDVHVQRVPATGRVVASSFTHGRKVAAFRADAGDVNENHLTVIRRGEEAGELGGDRIGVRQIAGLMARRVVCYLEPGQEVSRSQHLGLIKFGSRVDLLLPAHYEVLVAKGDRVKNGETVMARPAAEVGAPEGR